LDYNPSKDKISDPHREYFTALKLCEL
jgi:hypothetical protein